MCAKYESGKVIKGETYIDEDNHEKTRIVEAFLEPVVNPNIKAVERIKNTDYLIVGPGDLYTSIIPVLLVDDLKSKIRDSATKIIYIMNLVTKAGQTFNYKATDHIADLTKYLGRSPDIVVINNGEILPEVIEWYTSHGEKAVEDNLKDSSFTGQIIRADIVDRKQVSKPSADKLTRSIMRHDSEKLAEALLKII